MGCGNGSCSTALVPAGIASPCCGACAVGAPCDCDPNRLPDRKCPPNTVPAYDPTTGSVLPSTVAQAVIPPGYFNCESYKNDLALCDVERIERTRRRWTAIGQTSAGTLVDVTAIYAAELPTPAGYSWYRIVENQVDVAHSGCLREVVAQLYPDGVGPPVDTPVEDVALQAEAIYQDANGNFVHAWDWPAPADPDDLKITNERCACEMLCVCVRAQGDLGILVLLPTLTPGDLYVVTAKGIRDQWKISCGDCPPGLLCGREIIT